MKFLKNDKTLAALVLSGAGEIIMDKLPATPARTDAGGLSGRVTSGAVAGAALSQAIGKKPAQGALISGLSALASTFACYYLRKSFSKATKIPDPYAGAVEDALAIVFGILLLKHNRTKKPQINS